MTGNPLSPSSEAVAVITRTRDRPLLLRRARRSVSGQTFRDLTWIVVNDGGEPAQVETEVAIACREGLRASVIHRPTSAGMEAASNAGVRTSKSRYIVLHDDDDSWTPEFLATAVGALDADERFIGVVTHTAIIVEEIRGDAVVRLDRYLHNRWLRAVHLADLAVVNLFPPISFVYRREAYEAVAGYDESFPVLGDWEFNLKIAILGDILVVPKALANLHIRAAQSEAPAAYANSVVARRDLHHLQEAMFRNRLLRADIDAQRFGLGWLLAQGRLKLHPNRRRSVSNRTMSAIRIFISKHLARRSREMT